MKCREQEAFPQKNIARNHGHRDYKRIEASSRYKFSQARGSN